MPIQGDADEFLFSSTGGIHAPGRGQVLQHLPLHHPYGKGAAGRGHEVGDFWIVDEVKHLVRTLV